MTGAALAAEPGDSRLELGWLGFPVIVLLLAAAVRWGRLHAWLEDLLLPATGEGPVPGRGQRYLWPAAGFLAVLIALLLLERAYPYYFVQSDNLAQNLPVILWGCRNFFHGVFPAWNPYQYAGSPIASVGWYALTYPFTYLSYGFAKTVLRNENALLDVFSIAHLLAAYVVIHWAIRRERCRPAIAAFAAASCALSGFALIFSRSWFQFAPPLFWTALMVICVQELGRRRASARWILAFGATIGLFFHAGHLQMWVYSLMLIDFALLLLLLSRAISYYDLLAALSAHLVGFAIAAPLLVPQALATYHSLRRPESAGIWSGLAGLLLPVTLSRATHPLNWSSGRPIGEMYYSGTVFVALVAGLLISLLVLRWRQRLVAANVWFLCALLALVLALGSRGVLWTGLAYLPGFDRFRYPFKFLGCFVLFATTAGAIALERLFVSRPRWARFETVILGAGWVLLAYHCTLCTAAFSNYAFKPFPRPDPQILARLQPAGDRSYPRVLPGEQVGFGRFSIFREVPLVSNDPHIIDSLINQWPTALGIFSLDGYDDMVAKSAPVLRMVPEYRRDRQRMLFEHGVNYILQYDAPDLDHSRVFIRWQGSKLVYQSDTVFLSETEAARPMAFATATPDHALPVKFDGGGATIDVSEAPPGSPVVLNMLWRSEIQARVHGARVPATADDWGRILVSLPPGASQVRVSFCSPWGLGFLAGGLLLAAAVTLMILMRRMQPGIPNHQ
jgi:hypothetical protein